MRRREFISLLGGSVVWPLAARAQQQKLSRIGVLTGIAANDAETKARFAAFSQELQRLGWIEGRDVQFDIRGGAGLTAGGRKNAAELVAKSDVLLAWQRAHSAFNRGNADGAYCLYRCDRSGWSGLRREFVAARP